MKILVLDLHTEKDLTEGPKISKALEHYVETSTVRVLSPKFSLEKLTLETYEGIVLTGSDHPLLLKQYNVRKLGYYLREIAHKFYVLGICAGYEVLSKAYGYEVYQLPPEKREVGWPVVHLTEQGKTNPLFRGFPESFRPFEYHDKAVRGVEESKVLARSDRFLQALWFEYCVYGVQFHPEEDLESGSEFMRKKSEKLSEYFDVSAIITSRPKEHIEWRIFPNFVDMIKQKA